MQQDVAVKHKRTGGRRIPEIHADLYAVEWSLAFPERNFDRVAHVLVGDRLSIDFQHLKVNLVHVESMGLQGSVLDRPILDRPYFGGDDWLFVALEDFLLLSFHRDVKLDGAVGACKLLRKKQLALYSWGLSGQVGRLQLDRRRWLGSFRHA